MAQAQSIEPAQSNETGRKINVYCADDDAKAFFLVFLLAVWACGGDG